MDGRCHISRAWQNESRSGGSHQVPTPLTWELCQWNLSLSLPCLMYSQLSHFWQSYNFSTKDKALPFIASLVKRAAEKELQEKFSQIKDSPLVQELPIRESVAFTAYCLTGWQSYPMNFLASSTGLSLLSLWFIIYCQAETQTKLKLSYWHTRAPSWILS